MAHFETVFFSCLLYLLNVVQFLKVFLHEVLELERFMIQTLREILLQHLLVLILAHILLIFQIFKLFVDGVLKCLEVLGFELLSFLEILFLDASFELLVPVMLQWRQFCDRKPVI